MIQSFRNQRMEDVFNGRTNKKAIKVLPLKLWRVAGRYRICFRWADDGAHEVEITDYH